MSERIKNKKNSRIHSLDITRGAIVFLSIFTFSVQGIFSHASWYGITLLDMIFPAFITIFGTSMAIAYRKGVRASRLAKRTIRLIIFGLLFNMIAAWSMDLSTLRFTGVLQMFAVFGVLTVIITKYVKNLGMLIALSLAIFSIHGIALLAVGQGCEEGLPQVGCNPSHFIDPVIFGESHTYAQGERGHDPEGIPSMFAALGNVLLGFVAGKLLLQKGKGTGKKLLLFSGSIIFLSLLIEQIIPFGKRLWTPSFGLLTAGVTILLLFFCYILFDRRNNEKVNPVKGTVQWVMEAYGRNSFLVYFGKYVLYAVLININITFVNETKSIYSWLMEAFGNFGLPPKLVYFIIFFGFWLIITLLAHKKRIYVKI